MWMLIRRCETGFIYGFNIMHASNVGDIQLITPLVSEITNVHNFHRGVKLYKLGNLTRFSFMVCH
jgi:hypothetical protein